MRNKKQKTTAQISFSLLILIVAPASSAFVELPAAEEYQQKSKQNSAKIADFYQRMIDLDRKEAERRSGEEEMRQRRKLRVAEKEKERLEFVQQRKAKPPMDPTAWEQELIERKKAYKKSEGDYVRRRKELERLFKQMGKISEEDEYDLNLQPNPQE